MDAQNLIDENNKKRKMLTKENKDYYEDMLVYIRLSFNKSEQETEEALSELLDHLLEAQKMGKTAEEVFGDNPKQYAEDIVGALPKMLTKERTQVILMSILYFLAAVIFFDGIVKLVMHYLFHKGEIIETYYTGTILAKTIIFIPLSLALVYLILRYLQWSCFKQMNKILEFVIYWIFGIFLVGIFMLVIFLIPDFGPPLQVPGYLLLVIGLLLFIVARRTRTGKWIGRES